MALTKRPRRQNKGDRLVSPDARAEEIRCDHAVAPFDRLAREMDDKWGINRLPELVSPETAERYGSAIAKLNAALSAADPEEVVKRANVCMRGLKVMDEEATALGRKPNSSEWWECEVGDFKFAIVRQIENWPHVKKERPDLAIYSLREIGIILRAAAQTPFIAQTKAAFPGSEIARITPSKLPDTFWQGGGDEIDFSGDTQ